MSPVKNHLKDSLSEKIEANGGSISFADFMHHALYAPGMGYYSGASEKFGAAGDFITAPELSPLFGQSLASQVQELLSNESLTAVLEFGAGTGQLALNLLLQLEKLNSLPGTYYIVELSGNLKARQKQLFQSHAPQLLSRIQWLDGLPEQSIDAVMIANEVLDAMPVERFQIDKGDIKMLCVGYDGNNFIECLKPASPALLKAVESLGPLPEGYQSEVNLWLMPWLKACYQSLSRGLVLLIDYGYSQGEYYHPERKGGTLMCHFKHRAHTNPYLNIGEQDITAHVNFTAVAECAHELGFEIEGYTNQASFLLANDLLALAQSTDEVLQFNHNQVVKTLTLPHEMGELFKVIGLGKKLAGRMKGFSLLDLRRTL